MNEQQISDFNKVIETTEKEAVRFFERHSSLDTAEKLIEMASFVGMFDRSDIDVDLFRHLMRKYTWESTKQAAARVNYLNERIKVTNET